MSAATIKAAIVSVMEGVADIGVVNDRPRYAKRLADVADLYVSEDHGEVRGWDVKRVKRTEMRPLTAARGVEETQWRITGYLSLVDATDSEAELDALVDALIDAFAADPTLGDTVAGIHIESSEGPVGLQLEQSDFVTLGDVLCHRAICALYTTRYLEA